MVGLPPTLVFAMWPDQSCDLSRHNLNKENESNEDTEPRHCRNLLKGELVEPVSKSQGGLL